MVARNVRSGRDEIDLIVRFGARRVAVEVKTRTAGALDPVESFTAAKAHRVRRAARSLGIGRVDLVGVTVGEAGVDFRWLRDV